MGKANKCKCCCHYMGGIFVILFGLTFLLGSFNVLSQQAVHTIWPIIVILAGGKMLIKGMCKCCADA